MVTTLSDICILFYVSLLVIMYDEQFLITFIHSVSSFMYKTNVFLILCSCL